jgi:nicotinate-nucleotide pyrophosphorylase (carboxylating)
MQIARAEIREIVGRALAEDLGRGDLSSEAVFTPEAAGSAVILAKENGILAGMPVAEETFRLVDSNVVFKMCMQDGQEMSPGQTVAELRGPLLAILAGERVALNFLQRLSGIATLTRCFVRAVEDLPVQILDTRKTTPGLRILEKYAVRIGGGRNHRFGLYDGVILKDNHIAAAGGIESAVERARRSVPPTIKIEVEASSFQEVEAALRAGADLIMLDNMSLEQMREAVRRIGGRARVEASGGVKIDTVRQVAETGVDYISVGALTHSAPAVDMSLEVRPK